MSRPSRVRDLGAALSLALLCAQASAASLISNMPGNDGTQTAQVSDLRGKGMGFTTPAGAPYTITSVDVRLNAPVGAMPILTLNASSGGAIGPVLFTFANPGSFSGGIATCTFTGSYALTASTTYWLVMFGTAGAPTFDWKASSPSQTPTGLATHFGSRFTTTGGSSWSTSTILVSYEIFADAGPSCTINAPASGVTVGGIVQIDFDADHSTGLPVDALVQFSTNAGATYDSATPLPPGVNPILAIATPASGQIFDWDSDADGVGQIMVASVDLRVTVDDGTDSNTCDVTGVLVDNVPPPPTCTLTMTDPSPVRNDVPFEFVGDSMHTAVVEALLEYSTDSGASYMVATAAAASANPMLGVPITIPTAFIWDSRADAIGLVTPVGGVLMRATVSDSISPLSSVCVSAAFDVDNTALCQTICGDCDDNGLGPTITDALIAAQISAGIVTPSITQTGCCDVNASGTITITDALAIAQDSAGIPGVTLTCP